MFRKPLGVLLALLVLPGCMSDREYQLRSKQLANQARHPATYDLVKVEGPLKIELAEGGKAQVTVPGQPFRELAIPDGVAAQTDLVKHLVNVGAIGVLGWKALDSVNRTSTATTTTTMTGDSPCE